jgi:hypothetical protein
MFGTKKPKPLHNTVEGQGNHPPTVYLPSIDDSNGKNGGGKLNLILAIKDNAPNGIKELSAEKNTLLARVAVIDREIDILSAVLLTVHDVEKKYANRP